MIETKNVRGKSFAADQAGIDELKGDFLREAKQFCYYRKGEWTGVAESVRQLSEWTILHPEWVPVALALYRPSKELLSDLRKVTKISVNALESMFFGKRPDRRKTHVTVRVIVGKRRGGKKDMSKWEALCGERSVARIPASQVGPFRYIVNDKRYAIFTRSGPNRLQGIIGGDESTITALRDKFDREFIEALSGELRKSA